MKKKTEIVLTAFAAEVETLNNLPEVETEVELTDEQIDALANKADGKTSPTYQAACDLLEAIHSEEPYFQTIETETRKDLWEEHEQRVDTGLTTEINRSTSLVSLAATLDGCAEVLKRHPYGFKNGSRNSKGQPGLKPFTEAENIAAEKWLASIKNGTPMVAAEDEAD